jgi:hypothetical protein
LIFKSDHQRPNYEAGCLSEEVYGNLLSGTVNVQYWRDHQSLREFSAKNNDHVQGMSQYYSELQGMDG